MKWRAGHPSQTPAVERAMERLAQQIHDDAVVMAPRKTGALRRSLMVLRHEEDGVVTYRVGWDVDIAEYGPAIEFGSGDLSPQPHIRPSGNKAKRRRRRRA